MTQPNHEAGPEPLNLLAAAHAWRALAAAHGLGPVDLAADGSSPASGTDNSV
jgi:hypothetical protein